MNTRRFSFHLSFGGFFLGAVVCFILSAISLKPVAIYGVYAHHASNSKELVQASSLDSLQILLENRGVTGENDTTSFPHLIFVELENRSSTMLNVAVFDSLTVWDGLFATKVWRMTDASIWMKWK